MSTTVKYKVVFRKTGAGPAQESPTLPTVATGEDPCASGTIERKERPNRNVGRVARMLALAYKVEREVEAGRLKDYATAARHLGISRARMSQVLDLLNLSPRLQALVLMGTCELGERRLRTLLREPCWKTQELLTPRLIVCGP